MPGSTLPRTLRAALTSTLLCGALVATGGAAQARDVARGHALLPTPGTPEVLVDGLVGPLSLSVGKHRTVYVSQDFASEIGAVHDGAYTTLVSGAADGIEHAGVSSLGRTVYFATTDFPDEGTTDPIVATLWERDARGHVTELADLAEHEATHNPDGDVRYGFTDLPDGCELPDGYPFGYTGVVEAHPYATTPWRGSVYVADAAGNDILAVDRRGTITTVAVLPPIPITVTQSMVDMLMLPPCTVGTTYLLEPVPTDVEAGRDGWLYVSALPGGPEDPGMPPAGSVFRVSPRTGEVQLVASGLVSAVDLAVGTRGEIYVAELFAGRVSVIPPGSSTPEPFLEGLALPGAVEVEGRTMYLTTEVFPGEDGPSGKVLRVPLRH